MSLCLSDIFLPAMLCQRITPFGLCAVNVIIILNKMMHPNTTCASFSVVRRSLLFFLPFSLRDMHCDIKWLAFPHLSRVLLYSGQLFFSKIWTVPQYLRLRIYTFALGLFFLYGECVLCVRYPVPTPFCANERIVLLGICQFTLLGRGFVFSRVSSLLTPNTVLSLIMASSNVSQNVDVGACIQTSER